jgi:hypothetical protein
MPAIEIAAAANGTLTYLIHDAPAALPPVLRRDLLAAWEAARSAALAAASPSYPAAEAHPRAFRFAWPDGRVTDLSLSDPDARFWAQAADRRLTIASAYGLSVCLRLLALIDLLAVAPWARAHVALHPTGADLHPGLLRLAAEAKLTDEAGFDEAAFRARLTPRLPGTSKTGPETGQGAPRS